MFVRDFEYEIFTVARGKIDRATGRKEGDVWTEKVLRGNLQPVSGEMLKRLPEGRDIDDFVNFWSYLEFPNQGLLYDPDTDQTYEVFKRQAWRDKNAPLPHYHCILELQKTISHITGFKSRDLLSRGETLSVLLTVNNTAADAEILSVLLP